MELTLSIIAIALSTVALIVALIGSPIFIYIALQSFRTTKEFGEVVAAYRNKTSQADQAREEADQKAKGVEQLREEMEQLRERMEQRAKAAEQLKEELEQKLKETK